MSSAIFALVVNAVVALLFAAVFSSIAASNPSFRRVYWFAAAYVIGALTPVSELLVRFSGFPAPFVASSFITFVIAFYVTAVALCRFYGQPVPWAQFVFLMVISFVTRALIWHGPRDNLFYELTYQLPFAVATLICALMILQARPYRKLDVMLCVLFCVSSLHFMVKPFLAARFGSGSTAPDYIASAYALFSQSATGILLVSIGLSLLLIVVRDMLSEVHKVADHDALSGLLNRRGFTRQSRANLARAYKKQKAVALLMFDIDHFKKLNDTYGHDIGDWFIAAFAEILRISCPPEAVIARLGGEEFAVLIVEDERDSAHTFGENVRKHLLHLSNDHHPELRVTVSAGLVTSTADITLSELMKRSDKALYLAKASGRDRICLDRVTRREPVTTVSNAISVDV